MDEAADAVALQVDGILLDPRHAARGREVFLGASGSLLRQFRLYFGMGCGDRTHLTEFVTPLSVGLARMAENKAGGRATGANKSRLCPPCNLVLPMPGPAAARETWPDRCPIRDGGENSLW